MSLLSIEGFFDKEKTEKTNQKKQSVEDERIEFELVFTKSIDI